MNYKNLSPFLLSTIIIILGSCNNEFSKYKKDGETDLEKSHLLGNVKSVTRYFDGKLTRKTSYNKYGFITEDVDYSDGEVEEIISYSYNEFGKITSKETKNKELRKAELTSYDEYGNPIEDSEEIYEIFDANSNATIGKKLKYTYENKYDKLGGLISQKGFRRNGSPFYERQYNQSGKKSKVIFYDDDGSVNEYIDYSYSGNVLLEEKHTYPKSRSRFYIVNYNQKGKIEKTARLYEDGSIDEIQESIFDYTGNVVKEISTWVVSLSWDSELSPGDICHTVTQSERDEHGSELKRTKTTYYPKDDLSIPKEPEEEKTFQYRYDTHGNVIYFKDYDGREDEYEIEYY